MSNRELAQVVADLIACCHAAGYTQGLLSEMTDPDRSTPPVLRAAHLESYQVQTAALCDRLLSELGLDRDHVDSLLDKSKAILASQERRAERVSIAKEIAAEILQAQHTNTSTVGDE